MIVVIDGKVQNSEDSIVSVLFYQNEREDMARALANGQDIFNSFPLDAPKENVQKNEDILKNAKAARDAKQDQEIKEG